MQCEKAEHWNRPIHPNDSRVFAKEFCRMVSKRIEATEREGKNSEIIPSIASNFAILNQ